MPSGAREQLFLEEKSGIKKNTRAGDSACLTDFNILMETEMLRPFLFFLSTLQCCVSIVPHLNFNFQMNSNLDQNKCLPLSACHENNESFPGKNLTLKRNRNKI